MVALLVEVASVDWVTVEKDNRAEDDTVASWYPKFAPANAFELAERSVIA